MINPLLTAIKTLTVIPVPGKDNGSFARSLPFFPVVGFLLGGAVSYCIKGVQYSNLDNALLLAVIALIIETVLTGGLHIDGLGDVADGFGSRKSKEEILAIFKDSRLGVFGVCAVVFDLLLKTICWAALIQINLLSIIVLSLVAGRSIQPLIILFFPKVQKQSLLNAFQSSNTGIKVSVIVSFCVATSLCCLFIPLTFLLLCMVTAFITTLLFSIWCAYKIGGITGDCVGAVNEIVEVSVLVGGIMIYYTNI